MVDVAACIGPGLPQEVVGIRPGEKLHEVMVPEDDARNAVEIDDRYIVLPAFGDAPTRDWIGRGARAVAPDLHYASDSNHEWLRSEERRVGKECVSTCRSRRSPDHSKKKIHK